MIKMSRIDTVYRRLSKMVLMLSTASVKGMKMMIQVIKKIEKNITEKS